MRAGFYQATQVPRCGVLASDKCRFANLIASFERLSVGLQIGGRLPRPFRYFISEGLPLEGQSRQSDRRQRPYIGDFLAASPPRTRFAHAPHARLDVEYIADQAFLDQVANGVEVPIPATVMVDR